MTLRAPDRTVHVGFELGSGDPIEIPVRHMAVTGQTQESGKTTTLEALISCAAARTGTTSAIAFVTKRGEMSFGGARRVAPYFRDRADWQFVTSLIDATLQEKNKFLRPWIMKICRTTRTLADVHAEVRKALRNAKGINEGVYTQLDAYLELIVPEISRVPMTSGLDLELGLNVMDLGGFNTPMQMLFVQSAIDWVNDHARDTIVIVPEAWEFIPEQKGSPVKASAVSLVRKGAGLGNYIWVDSQDMAGVDKTILRGCTVWLIGVQREANEIKRNIANIPAGIRRPKPADIAHLDRGQFFACWKDRTVKVYVQPTWMNAAQAQQVATGQLSVEMAARLSPRPLAAPPPPTPQEEPRVNESEARALRAENDELRRRLRELEQRLSAPSSNDKVSESAPASGRPPKGDAGSTPAGATAQREYSLGESLDNEALYQAIKRRLSEEAPSLLRVLVEKPELRVEVERPVIDAKGDSLRGRIAQLIAGGFYDRGATAPGTQKELGRRGQDPGPANTYKELDTLALLGFLTIEQGRDERSRPRKEYKAVPGMKVNIVERGGR